LTRTIGGTTSTASECDSTSVTWETVVPGDGGWNYDVTEVLSYTVKTTGGTSP
jgi:hypothetical protein